VTLERGGRGVSSGVDSPQAATPAPAPGKSTLTQPAGIASAQGSSPSIDPGRATLTEPAEQARSNAAPKGRPHEAATRGIAEAHERLPYLERIRRSFGRHDVSDVKVAIGGQAATAGAELGAQAYTYGDRIAFSSPPDLHTAAHEAAHVVQQRAGVTDLTGGIGKTGDHHEQQADAVADAVVAGRSAEAILDGRAGGAPTSTAPAASGAAVIQRKDKVQSVTADDYLQWRLQSFHDEVGTAIQRIGMVKSGPWGKFLGAAGTLEVALAHEIRDRCVQRMVIDGYRRLVAPDSIEAMVNRARGHDWDNSDEDNPKQVPDKGPDSNTYSSPVAVEVTNSLARRYITSIQKLIPEAMDLYIASLFLTSMMTEGQPDPRTLTKSKFPMQLRGQLVPTHPMDGVVISALDTAYKDIPYDQIAKSYPEIFEKYQKQADTTHTYGPEVRKPLRPARLTFKASEGLYHWLVATPKDGGDPCTAAEVANTLFFGGADFRDTEATEEANRLIPVPPLWGFHGRDIKLFKREHRDELFRQWAVDYRAAQAAPGTEPKRPPWPFEIESQLMPSLGLPGAAPVVIDPMAELTKGSPAQALESAKSLVPTDPLAPPKDEASVVSRLWEDLQLVASIARALGAMSAPLEHIDDVQAALEDRQREASSASLMDPASSFALCDRQGVVLADLASGLNELAIKYAMYSAEGIDPAIQAIFDDCLEPIQSALVAIDFPEVATARAELATQRILAFDISVQEMSLHQGMPAVDEQLNQDKPTDGVDAKEQEKQSNEFAYDLGAMRMGMASDPAKARTQLDAAAPKIGDLEFDISLGEKLMRLDQFWTAIEDEEDFWEDIGDKFDGDDIQGQCKALRLKFVAQVKEPYAVAKAENNQEKKVAVRAAFKELILNEFVPMANKVRSFIKTAEKHKRWTKIIVGILICIVAFSLGQFEFAALIAEGASVLEASVVAGVVTTTTSAVLDKLILNQDPTVGSLITGFIGNVAMFGMIGRAMMAARAAGVAAELGEGAVGAARAANEAATVAYGADAAANGASVGVKAAKWVGGFTLEIVFGEAIILVQSEVTSLIDNGRTLTIDELKETLAMGVVNIIGMKVGQFGFDKAVDNFKGIRAASKIDIDGLMAMRNELKADGVKLNESAGGEGHLAKGRAPREQAQALMEQWQRYFEKEREVAEQLMELAEKHPEHFKARIAELEKLKGTAAKDGELAKQFRQQRALLGIEEIGPNLYRGDPAALDAILTQHKASGSELVEVTTDPVTGQRKVSIKMADGMPVDIVEKLADPGKRKQPKVPVGEARHFEEWLSKMDRSTPEGAQAHQRMLEYYAREPDAAIKLAAEHYNYGPGELATPELLVQPDAAAAPPVEPVVDPAAKPGDTNGPKAAGKQPEVAPGEPATPSEAQRAYEHFEYTQEGKEKVSVPGDQDSPTSREQPMSRSDFEKMYEGGFEYDPVSRGFKPRKGATPAANTSAIATTNEGTHVLGEVHSEAVGHELMRKLVAGESEALRVVGIEPPPEFDSRGNEWGLGRDQNGKIVLIRGGKGAVDWSLLPGIEDIAHSHPYFDPVTGKPRAIKGEGGSGVLDINQLKNTSVSNGVLMDLMNVMPSTGDLRFVTLKGKGGHRVHTPYISLGEGKIGNPIEGGLQPTVEIEITNAEAIGLLTPDSEIVVYRGELTLWAGDTQIGTLEIYQRYHSSGRFGMDWITTERPAGVAPLPADHPISRYLSTPAGEVKGIGHISGDTMAKLAARGFPKPGENTALEAGLKRVGQKGADTIDALAMHDHLTNFEAWIDRVTKNPSDLPAAIKDLEKARAALEQDTALEIKFDDEGKPTWEGDGKKPAAKKGPQKAAETRAAKENERLNDARERAHDAMGKGPADEQWLFNVERGFGTEGRGARPFFELLATRAGEIDMTQFRPLVEDVLADGRLEPAQRRALVEHALARMIDPVQFLTDVRWLSERSQLPEARANLMNSAMRGTLEIGWLKSRTELTPVELDQLALRSNTPWNKFQIVSEFAESQRAKAQPKPYGPQVGPEPEPTPIQIEGEKAVAKRAGEAAKAAQFPIRGTAGEIAATRAKLPHGFEIVEHGTPQTDGLHPDYLLRDKAGLEADLEVKATNPDNFKKALRDMKSGKADVDTVKTMERMVRQLKASRARGRKVYLAVSEGMMKGKGRQLLDEFLAEHGAMPDELVGMSEADIAETSRALREHLGIQQQESGTEPVDAATVGDE
jgi:hypothetical protein